MTPALRVLYMANDCFDSVDFASFSSARWVSIVSHNVSIRKLVQHKKIMWRIRDARNIFPTLSIILHHHRVYGYFETTHKNLSFICLFWFLKGACQILPCWCSPQRRRWLPQSIIWRAPSHSLPSNFFIDFFLQTITSSCRIQWICCYYKI